MTISDSTAPAAAIGSVTSRGWKRGNQTLTMLERYRPLFGPTRLF
jgi:hypothetical protein